MDESLEVPKEEASYKTSFDGRQMYYQVMGKFMMAQKVSALQGSVRDWYRGIRILFNMCQAYIDPSEVDRIKKLFAAIDGEMVKYDHAKLPKSKAIIGGNIERSLLELEEELHTAARAVFLPVKEQRETKWDDEEFLRGSDA